MGRHGDGGPQQEAKHVCQPHHCLHGASVTNCARARGKEGEGSQHGKAGILGMLAVLWVCNTWRVRAAPRCRSPAPSTRRSKDLRADPRCARIAIYGRSVTCRNCYWQRGEISLQESVYVYNSLLYEQRRTQLQLASPTKGQEPPRCVIPLNAPYYSIPSRCGNIISFKIKDGPSKGGLRQTTTN
jgi:hypothetical protein